MKRHLYNLQVALATVFVRPSYLLAASLLAVSAFLLAVLFPNLELLGAVLGDPSVALATRLSFVLSLLGGIGTNFSLLSAGYTIAIAVLFGINTAMIVYLIRQRRAAAAGQNIAVGSGALASGVLGIGCAACGSLVAAAVFSFVGAGGALAVLPLNGGEFGILSVALLLVSLLLLSRTVAQPAACPLPAAKSSAALPRDRPPRPGRSWGRKPSTFPLKQRR